MEDKLDQQASIRIVVELKATPMAIHRAHKLLHDNKHRYWHENISLTPRIISCKLLIIILILIQYGNKAINFIIDLDLDHCAS